MNKNKRPDSPGIWEWFDEDGTKRLVVVYDVSEPLRKAFPNEPPYLRVRWWGGEYNINDEHDPENPQYYKYMKSEWADRWGEFIGPIGSVQEELLYSMPTEEQLKQIREENNL